MSALAELFPDGDYRFHLTLRRGEPREFFTPRDPTGKILAERARSLTEAPDRHVAWTPEGQPLLAEFAGMITEWKIAPGAAKIAALGAGLEPDFLLLSPDETGAFRLRGGALCFPTGWALEEKIGHPIDFIHGVVPGLNPALASPIGQFLARIKPGPAFLRDNWGLAATDELNLHPSCRIAPPALPLALDRLWLRVEHQALFALPSACGIVFAIRIALHRLDEVARDRGAAAGLRRALESMPAALAEYKHLTPIRATLIERLKLGSISP